MIRAVTDADTDKLKKAIKALPLRRKREVLAMLEEELFAVRFKRLLKEFRESARKYPVTMEEISEEVETVRRRRYEDCN
jgi:hypothetical protein